MHSNYWLLKTEPHVWSWDMQVQRGSAGEPWSGVRNHAAKNHLRAMKFGERAFFYHSGQDKQIVGIVEVIREAYPDPTDETGRFFAVTVKAVAPLKHPVSLAAAKADARLNAMILTTNTRLSVQPVTKAEWDVICALASVRRAGP